MLRTRVLMLVEKTVLPQLGRCRSTATMTNEAEKVTAPTDPLPFDAMPGPKSLPLIGTKWMHLPGGPLYGLTFYNKIIKMRELYGDVIREQLLPSLAMVHLYRPEDFEAAYRKEGKYPDRVGFFMLNRYNTKYNNGIHGIIDGQGEHWHRLRTQVQQKMLKPRAVSAYFNDQAHVADDFISTIRNIRDTDYVIKDFLELLYAFATESIGAVCFNKRIGALSLGPAANSSEARQFIKSVSDVFTASQTEINSLFLFMYFDTPMFKRLVQAMDNIRSVSLRHAQESVEKVLGAAVEGVEVDGEHGDLIPYLMTKTDLSEVEVMTVIAEFFFAGVDTTSHMLAFILYNLCKNPEVMRKLRQEVDSLVPNKQALTPECINKMSYMKAVVKESLRVLPVVPGNGRRTTSETVVAGYKVPQGTIIGLHHDTAGHEEYHFKDADKFIPERWMRTPDKQQFHSFIFMPFGYGPRKCIGKRFAEQEVHLALVKIMQNFEIEYSHHSPLKIEMKIINTPVTPVSFRFKDRK